jgi:RNA polymerase-binding protein DksA
MTPPSSRRRASTASKSSTSESPKASAKADTKTKKASKPKVAGAKVAARKSSSGAAASKTTRTKKAAAKKLPGAKVSGSALKRNTKSSAGASKAATKVSRKKASARKGAGSDGKSTVQKKRATAEATIKKPSPKKSASKAAAAKKVTRARPTGGAKFGTRFMAAVQRRLEDERLRLVAQLEELEKERQILAEDREDRDDAFTEESGEGASTLAEQDREEKLSIRIRDLLEKVEKAVQKISKGTYGLCERCGKPIERARLDALPYAELCIECKRKEERRF